MLATSIRKSAAVTSLLLLFAAPGVLAGEESINLDPLEGFNRAMFSFNDGVDRVAIKPLTQGYRYVVPDVAQTGVTNFFSNLRDVRTLLNNLLQGKLHNASEDFVRLSFNTVWGIGGLIDVATPLGIPKNNEDFGQTLGYWGVSSGPYIVLPLLGPSTFRDTAGLVPDMMADPVRYVDDRALRNSLQVVRVLDTRSRLMDSERLISGDRYIFVRDAYLQRREFLINDGQVEITFDETDF
ncbi:VacJ family lipoprotein [Nitrincola alkalilacustris]|uniref:MlaA family lipoprotein n=1 Tax=Nitrincola alkalilacustris TaxID=1571224 RepID=UPI00124BD8B3|nr:VacJ family lipoprotein [Nitrincola alkalilacustris]